MDGWWTENSPAPLGRDGKLVEADEAYHGKRETPRANRGCILMRAVLYDTVGTEFATHNTVNHGAKEYAGADVTTNSVEGLFGIFKRGKVGVYQHCGEQRLQRSLDEFSFRYNKRVRLGRHDEQRTRIATYGMSHKRLTYRRTDAA